MQLSESCGLDSNSSRTAMLKKRRTPYIRTGYFKHPFNPNGIECVAKHGKLINPNHQAGEFVDEDFFDEMVDKGLVLKPMLEYDGTQSGKKHLP